MIPRYALAVLAASMIVPIGCGGSDDSPSQPNTGGSSGTGGSGGSSAGGSGGTAGTSNGGDATFSPAAIGLDAEDVENPLRGQYLWLGNPAYPSGWTDIDSYQRYNWDQLESSAGVYDWKIIDDEIAAAKQRKGRFGMRVMALCQGCPGHTYQGAGSSIPDDLAQASNPLIATAPGESQKYVIPDWNSSAYLDRLQTLVQAIANRYHDEPTFAFVDVFSYGNWGEFHLYPFNQPGGPYDSSSQKPLTDSNAKLIVQRASAAFDNKLLVINSENHAALTEAVTTTSPPIGIRVDCLGSDGLAGGSVLDTVPGASERWRTAPFITEWCQVNLGSSGANLFVQGEAQVTAYHVSMLSSGNFQSPPSTTAEVDAFRKANVEAGYRLRTASVTVHVDPNGSIHANSQWMNDGVVPTYLAWRVMIGLRGPTNAEAELGLDLRKVMPDAPFDDDETISASAALEPGTYEVYLRIEDVQGVSPPMQLAMDGKNADGEYVLGSLTLP